MQFGTLEAFDYLHCLVCHSMVIKEVPDNLNEYYPAEYYSFVEKSTESRSLVKSTHIFQWLRAKYFQYLISKESTNIVGYVLSWLKKPLEGDMVAEVLSKAEITTQSKILDIGCGSGALLKLLYEFGYTKGMGIDPNIEKDVYFKDQKFVIKNKVEEYVKEVDALYDLVMLHHSFEHIPNPEEVLEAMKKLAHQETTFIVRIPLAATYASKHYRENWVAWDAPRHLFLYSEEGMRLMLKRHHFEILEVIYDSSEYQFWGSEQYAQGISLVEERSYGVTPSKSIFSEQDIWDFQKKAKELNKEKKGDAAAFIFRLNRSDSQV